METKVIPSRIFCTEHQDEVIIRVSIDSQDKKLFYCHDCLENEKKDKLVKFQDLISTLSQQYSLYSPKEENHQLPDDLKEACSNSAEWKMSFSERIAQQKQIADEELKKIEKAIIAMSKSIKEKGDSDLDHHENSFNELVKEFVEKIKVYDEMNSDPKSFEDKKEGLAMRIFGRDNDIDKTEKRLREVLKEINAREEALKESNIQLVNTLKSKIEDALQESKKLSNDNANEDKFSFLQDYLEALIFAAERREEKIGNVNGQEKFSQSLMKEVTKLNDKLTEANKNLDKLIAERWDLTITQEACFLTKYGLQGTIGEVYFCKTCESKYGDIASSDYICQSCKDCCHKDHEVVYVDTRNFRCHCQLVMRECQLAETCTYAYTKNNFTRLFFYRCRTCNMSRGSCVCSFCKKNCHAGHQLDIVECGSYAFCDCAPTFDFCKYHERGEEIEET